MSDPNPRRPLVGFHFFLEIQGKVTGAFREVSGLDSETTIVELVQSGPKGEEITIKTAGRLKVPNIELKRGMTDNMELWAWRKEVTDGKVHSTKKNGSIVMYDQEHKEVARYNFTNAWPSKITGPTLKADGDDIAVEGLTLAIEDLVRTK